MISRRQKNVCKTLNYIEHLLNLASVVTACVLISAFASLVGIPIGITSSVVEFKICVITAGIKKHKSITKKMKKNEKHSIITKN